MSASMNLALGLATAGAVLGAATAIGVFVVRNRRAARRAKRREQLKVLGKREKLDLLGETIPSDIVDLATRFRGGAQDIDLDDVMIGSDREGRHWLARRKVHGETHQVYGFEIRGELNVRGLHIEPVVKHARQPAWKRLLRQKPAGGQLETRMTWQSDPRRMGDELTRRSVDRWVKEVTATCQPNGKTPVGLEVHADHAWVHSLVPLEGVALGEFVRRAQEMRRHVLDEVMRRPATLAAPAVKVSADETRKAKAGVEDTGPVFAVPSAEGADTRGEAETVQLSAVDLLREAPDPRRRSGGRKVANAEHEFEIPEPEERVTLIRAD